MLLDKNKLQSYVPLSLKQNQLQPFFNSVRDRKVKKGFETDLARVETTKAVNNAKTNINLYSTSFSGVDWA